MTHKQRKGHARLVRLFHRWRGFRGNVDGVFDNSIVGWAASTSPRSGPLRVGLFTSRGMIAEATSNIFREDLLSSGIGEGFHGFTIQLDTVRRQSIAAAGGEADVCVLGRHSGRLGRIRIGGSTEARGIQSDPFSAATTPKPKGPMKALRHLLHGDLERLAAISAGDAGEVQTERRRPPLERHSPLFDPGDRLLGGTLPSPMTGYSDYVRYRYKQDAKFDIHSDPENLEHFLYWYLAGYATLRHDRRIPMSREMIDYFNEPIVIPGRRASLTRVTWSFLMNVHPVLHSMDFDNPAWVDWAVYWWSINQAHALHCEDCLVPDTYMERLSRIPDPWKNQRFPVTEFMIRLCNESQALSDLDLAEEADRRTLALCILVMAINRPDFLRYLPNESRDELLGPLGSAETGTPFDEFTELLTRCAVRGISAARYGQLLLDRGFDLENLSFTCFTDEGHRTEAAMLPAVTGNEKVDIQVIGPFEKASGLGQATRLSAASLAETSYTVNAVDFDLDNPAPEGFSSQATLSGYRPARINLLHLNAESIPLVFAYEPDAFSGAYNIGYFFWELDTPAACHHLALDMLDEIWVSTEYGVSIYRPATEKPVVNVGMCVEDLPDIDRDEARAFVTDRFGFEGDPFVFLTVFDSFSFVQRKNPVGTLRAFLQAFPTDDDVRLVIKTQNRVKVTDPVQKSIWDEVDALIADDPRIFIMDETLTYKDLLRLKWGCDCFVALHKSEGWGFGIIEAMNLGLPVVCTGYSGNMDFCSHETAWLVDYEEVELDADDYIFVIPGQKWAEPQVAHAAEQLKAIKAQNDARETRAAAARKNVQENFTAPAIGARYAARLKEILAGDR